MTLPGERLSGWTFVLPAVVLIGAFVLAPTLYMAGASFYRSTWQPGDARFVGGENYRALVRDEGFQRAARNTGIFTVLVVPLQALFALALALWTNRPQWSARWLRIAVFIPTTVSLAVLSVLWKLMYEPASATGGGLLNGLLDRAGLPTQPFLASPQQALYAIVAMSVWQGVGLQMMIFLSGLQSIPEQLYEAARLDGASRWRQFLHVSLPGLAPTVVVVVMITTIFALKLFVQPFLMTGGGPQGATRSLVQYVYEAAFLRRDLSLAYAAATLFTLAVLAVAVLQRLAFRRAEALQ